MLCPTPRTCHPERGDDTGPGAHQTRYPGHHSLEVEDRPQAASRATLGADLATNLCDPGETSDADLATLGADLATYPADLATLGADDLEIALDGGLLPCALETALDEYPEAVYHAADGPAASPPTGPPRRGAQVACSRPGPAH